MPGLSTASLPVTLSEVVLLCGEQFARKLGPISFSDVQADLPHTPEKVSTNELTRALLTSTFLDLEARGALRLEMQPRKTLFGLRAVPFLQIALEHERPTLPDGCLEGRVLHAVGDAGGLTDLAGALHGFVPRSKQPRSVVIDVVRQGLADRGLLAPMRAKMLGVLPVRKYVATDEARDLAARVDARLVRDQFQACERGRPDVWRALSGGIDAALDGLTERERDIND